MNYIAFKVLIVLFSLWYSCVQAIQNGTYSAIFAFGDSVLDTGNNNLLITTTRCNFPPYGRDFPKKFPSGRFGNGRVLSDFVAEKLGIKKEFLPAYRSLFLKPSDLSTGVSFASGGSGFDKLTATLMRVIWVQDQIKDFNRYKEKLTKEVGGDSAKVKEIISNALVLISAGNNDIAITFYASRIMKLRYNIQTYADVLIGWKTTFIRNLLDLGMRNFAIFGTLPIGCLPGAAKIRNGEYKCGEDIDYGARIYNQMVVNLVAKFSRNNPDATFVYVDIYNPLMELVNNPTKYGFTTPKPCCCSRMAPLPCSNTSNHIFWDFAHPTEKAYQIILPQVVNTIRNSSRSL